MSQQRRSRYTAYIADGTPKVILAYNAEQVRAYYKRCGYQVIGVERGDFRQKARAQAKRASGGFVVDQKALRDACALLDIKLPVRIRYNGRLGSTNGNYRFQGNSHDIMLKSYHTAEQASSTLWHELCHASQAERAGATSQDWTRTLNEQARFPYSRRPIEVEARKLSKTMADVSLTRPA